MPLGPPTIARTTSRVRAGLRHGLGEGADGDVGALVRLQPADEQEHLHVREVQARLGGVRLPGEEQLAVHPRRHDPDPVGIGPVQPDELRRLGGRCDEAVGVGDHPLLAIEPNRRLGSFAAREGIVSTFPRVWNDATSGTPQISRALRPTQPESQ